MLRINIQKRVTSLVVILVCVSGLLTAANAQKRRLLPSKLFVAKSVYFDNETGYAAVGGDALRELQKWGRFRVVQNRDQAELVLVLSSQEYSDNLDEFGPTDNKDFEPNWFLHFHHRPANAYLTVIDKPTGHTLWAASHVWGGLLTGFNSAGRRLVNRLRKEIDPGKQIPR